VPSIPESPSLQRQDPTFFVPIARTSLGVPDAQRWRWVFLPSG
jgi:hypothetical protein